MKMNIILKTACLLALGACLLGSCAKASTEGTNTTQKRYLDAWRAIHYPGSVEKDGIYVIEDIPGTGSAWTDTRAISFVTYTVRDLTGAVTSNTDEEWAKQLGTWDQTHYYGKQVVITGESASYAGLDVLLDGMRVGGTRTAIIPSWLMTLERYDGADEYFKHETSNSTAIYTVTLLGQTDNLNDYEFGEMKEYAAVNWGVTDTLSTAAVFFKSHAEFPEALAEMPQDTTFYINYTGRRISDGQVFDTTIADTAKFYHIYDPSRSYQPVSVAMAADVANISMGGSTSLINGFKYGLQAMHPGESASFLFGYNLGYGSSGGSDTKMVPPYAALRFDIDLVPKP